MASQPILSVRNICKDFEGVYALKNVSFDLQTGECLALVGENGAGKSTLMKVLSGVWPQGTFQGEIWYQRERLVLQSTLEARKKGISIIHQELCLFPKLTVMENLFLTECPPYRGEPSQVLWSRVSWNAMFSEAEALLNGLGFKVDPKALVEDLSVAEKQLVEVARAFHQQSRLLILDEPTSALSQVETDQLFETIRRMKNHVSFIYISHKLDEVFHLADRIIVMRDGMSVAELYPQRASPSEVIHHMVGRPVNEPLIRTQTVLGEKVLELKSVGHQSDKGLTVLEGVTFDLYRGEVVGVAGLMGSGRSELLRSLIGVLPGRRVGEITYEGRRVEWQTIQQAMNDGVAFVPEDRKKEGLFLEHSIGFNLTISVLREFASGLGWLDLSKVDARAIELSKHLGIRCASLSDPVKHLSGGNQQKVLLGKVVASHPKVLLLDEPTRGIDVGAKEEIYDIIRRLAAEGLAIGVVSSELPELLALSDRIIVLREGHFVCELKNDNLTQDRIMSLAAGTGSLA